MSGSTTPNYNFALPTIGGNQDSWGNLLNANWTAADSAIHGLASGYLPLSGGGTLTGNLVIAPTSGYASLTLNKPAGTTACGSQIEGAMAGRPRWTVELGDATAESGGNAGSNFSINRFDDSGSYLDSPLSIIRATGNVAIAHQLFANAVAITGGLTVGSNQGITGSLTVGNSVAVTGNVSATADLFCAGTGVVYSNIGTNGFAFRWNGANAYLRIDNSIEIGIQPLSDERLKADIATSTFDCLAAVLATPLFQFRWKTLGETSDLETATVAEDAPLVPIGFVAQRQQEVFPASVIPGSETSSGHARATMMWQMDHNALCAALCGAIQQLTERVAALELQLA